MPWLYNSTANNGRGCIISSISLSEANDNNAGSHFSLTTAFVSTQRAKQCFNVTSACATDVFTRAQKTIEKARQQQPIYDSNSMDNGNDKTQTVFAAQFSWWSATSGNRRCSSYALKLQTTDQRGYLLCKINSNKKRIIFKWNLHLSVYKCVPKKEILKLWRACVEISAWKSYWILNF